MIIGHSVDLVEQESFARLVAREEARELILVAGILRGGVPDQFLNRPRSERRERS